MSLVSLTGSAVAEDGVDGLVAIHQVSYGLLALRRALVDRISTARPALNTFSHQRVILLLLFHSVEFPRVQLVHSSGHSRPLCRYRSNSMIQVLVLLIERFVKPLVP